jgi:hypothetical protein
MEGNEVSSRNVAIIAFALALGLAFGIGVYAWTHNPSDAITAFVGVVFGTGMLGVATKEDPPNGPTRGSGSGNA